MRAILTVGYQKYLVQGDISSLMTAIDNLIPVQEKGGYGKEVYIPNGETEKFELTFVPNARVAMSAEEAEGKPSLLQALKEAEESASKASSEKWRAESELRALKKKLTDKGVNIPEGTKVEDIEIPF